MKTGFYIQTYAVGAYIYIYTHTGNACHFCNEVCWSTAALRSHMIVDVFSINARDNSLACHIWGRACRDECVQRGHISSHGCFLRDTFFYVKWQSLPCIYVCIFDGIYDPTVYKTCVFSTDLF